MFGTLKSNQSSKDPYLIETTRPAFEIHEAGKQCLQKFFAERRCAETVIHFIVRVAKNSTRILIMALILIFVCSSNAQ